MVIEKADNVSEDGREIMRIANLICETLNLNDINNSYHAINALWNVILNFYVNQSTMTCEQFKTKMREIHDGAEEIWEAQ
jgi:hypothetical protein